MAEGNKILVAVLTMSKAAADLEGLLNGLRSLLMPKGSEVYFVLIQNGVSSPTIDSSELGLTDYRNPNVISVERLGIPQARNAALKYAQEMGFDWLAFFDDDAIPDPNWIIELLAPTSRGGVDAVAGPQVPVFAGDTKTRLNRSKVYQEMKCAYGTQRTWAATNNVMFSVQFTEEMGLEFNEEMQSGGSDKEFFLRFHFSGGNIFWTDRAIVAEKIPTNRLTLSWIRRREWRKGATEFTIQSGVHRSFRAASLCALKSIYYFLSAAINLLQTLDSRRSGYVDAIADLSHAAGLVFGISPYFRPRKYT